MKREMMKWADGCMAAETKGTLPVLSFPGLQLTGTKVIEAVSDGEKQARCIQVVSEHYPTLAAVSFMDLSVEAEAFGSKVRYADNEVPTVIGHIVATQEDADALLVPAVGTGRTGECVKAVGIASREIQDKPVFAGIIGPFSLSGRLMEMTEIMVMMIEEPEMVQSVLEKATQFLVAYALEMKAAGANGVLIAEPAAGLISPDQCETFSSVYVKRIVEAVQDEHFMVILHNCGNTERMVDRMVMTGAKGFHFGNAVDMKVILPQVPADRLAFGNINPAVTLKNGTPEMVTEAVHTLRSAMKGFPNFILSSGCDIPPGTPVENLDAYFEAAFAPL